ncbi:hypothetical protein SmJEL517_g00153 [Synchytrium microbalum]|uniref:Uncharacterized protein n=1 Tax=Synchytrium microbalum TaxID=1806994 RepID=A0A507CJ08_9FUNG|nr:uncharacterized protein SmJEL517_g00153 [Synchytrium microbalum]TPX38164.1 hypothetical protein SmJEL517_g00153 [Synchytrium microbalum]
MSNTDQTLLSQIRNQYFQQIPIRLFNFHTIVPSLDLQEHILDTTTSAKRHQPHASYRLVFLKHLIHLCEVHALEVYEPIYDAVAACISTSNTETMTVKTYFPPSMQPIELHESMAMISGGTTGLVTWTASLRLAEYILANSNIFDKCSSVVELGAGAGLVSILASRLCKRDVYATDCHSQVVDNLIQNVELNQCSNVKVKVVDWEDKCTIGQVPASSFVLGADIVFDPVLIPHLLSTLDALMGDEAYIASTIRNQDTWNVFEDGLTQSEFQSVLVSVDNQAQKWIYPLEKEQVRIYKLSRKLK